MKKEEISADKIVFGIVAAMIVVAFSAYFMGFNKYIIMAAFFALLFYLFRVHEQYSSRVGRVDQLNKQLVSLGGVPMGDFGILASSDLYKELVSKLERSILDILVLDIVSHHSKVLIRKKKQKIYADDYGREIADEWMGELAYFAKNIFMPRLEELISRRGIAFEELYCDIDVRSKFSVDYWVHIIDFMLAAKQDEQAQFDGDFEIELDLDDVISGHDYEYFVSDLIKKAGWSAKVTAGSGDHGADVIAEFNGDRVAVQCKYFSSPVGNKSVQEAYSAKGFYDCDHACVVTNSSFTPAAKKAAAKLGVALLHHGDIESYFQGVSFDS